MIDGDFELDVNEILAELSEAEVLSIFFPIFRKSLVIDLRSLELSGPMIQIMQMVASPQERIRSIRRARPGFPRRPNLAIFPWPRNVNSLVSEGIWQQLTLVGRCWGYGTVLPFLAPVAPACIYQVRTHPF